MKPKNHLRIVCLLNKQSSRSHPQSFSATRSSKANLEESGIVPNLVYLSARIQGVDKNNQSRVISEIAKKIEENQSERHSLRVTGQEKSLGEMEDKEQSIRKYFQRQRERSEKEKMTIRNMMGSVDFLPDKREESKISKHIKMSFTKDQARERLSRKKRNPEEIIQIEQNRTFLEQDFKNFVINKETEYSHPKIVDLKEVENRQLRKLSNVNPERQSPKNPKDSARSLNLFSFLNEKQQKRLRLPMKQSRGFRFERINNNKRLQKKMMKLALNLKTQEYEFEWKKLQSDRSFNLCTLNS